MQTNALILKDPFVKLATPEKEGGFPLLLRRLLILFLIPILLDLSLHSPAHSAPKVQFTLIYTNDVMGEVEPCG
jgi:hypothetical protein